jgi:hypothetical protein
MTNAATDVIVSSNVAEQRMTRDGLCGSGTTSAPTVRAARTACGRLPAVSLLLRVPWGSTRPVLCSSLHRFALGKYRIGRV